MCDIAYYDTLVSESYNAAVSTGSASTKPLLDAAIDYYNITKKTFSDIRRCMLASVVSVQLSVIAQAPTSASFYASTISQFVQWMRSINNVRRCESTIRQMTSLIIGTLFYAGPGTVQAAINFFNRLSTGTLSSPILHYQVR